MLHKALSAGRRCRDASRIYGADHPAAGGAALSGPDRRTPKPGTFWLQTHARRSRATAKRAHWGDSSNKLSWLIPELAELLPEAQVRASGARRPKGRRVPISASWATSVTTTAPRDFAGAISTIRPAHARAAAGKEILVAGAAPRAIRVPREFRRFDQFERICLALGGDQSRRSWSRLTALPERPQFFVRLEDLAASPRLVKGLLRLS